MLINNKLTHSTINLTIVMLIIIYPSKYVHTTFKLITTTPYLWQDALSFPIPNLLHLTTFYSYHFMHSNFVMFNPQQQTLCLINRQESPGPIQINILLSLKTTILNKTILLIVLIVHNLHFYRIITRYFSP